MNRHRANSAFISMLFIFSISLMLFIAKDKLLFQENMAVQHSQGYVTDKFKMLNEPSEREALCRAQQQENIFNHYQFFDSHFQCERVAIFIEGKQPKRKYVEYNKIAEVFNLAAFEREIYSVASLAELPHSSESDPKIVMVTQSINERLEQDFYGIIITPYSFQFTNKKIYGVFVSPIAEDSNYRNISYSKTVVANLDKQYAFWRYVPMSRNILNKDEK